MAAKMEKMKNRLKEEVKRVLDPVMERVLYPEKYTSEGGKVPAGWLRPIKALEPRYRLSVRLELLCALKEYELELSRACIADTVAQEDAKRWNEENKECTHGAWEELPGGSRRCADCKEYIGREG